MFPFARGLYEDKVANLWCSLSPIIKINKYLPQQVIIRLCIALTCIGFLPACIKSMLKPTPISFIYSLVCCSFSFFMFSFQVHEKSILLPLLPATLLILHHPQFVSWLIIIATYSMYPLLQKDGLNLAYWSLQILFIYCFNQVKLVDTFTLFYIKKASICCILLLHAILAYVTPPDRYPDIFILMMSAFCFIHFFAAYMHTMYYQYQDAKIKRE